MTLGKNSISQMKRKKLRATIRIRLLTKSLQAKELAHSESRPLSEKAKEASRRNLKTASISSSTEKK